MRGSLPTEAASKNFDLEIRHRSFLNEGLIRIFDQDFNLKLQIDAASPNSQATISGSVLTIDPIVPLPENVGIIYEISSTAIEDLNGNSYAGITDVEPFYHTVDTEAPVITTDLISEISSDLTKVSMTSKRSHMIASTCSSVKRALMPPI